MTAVTIIGPGRHGTAIGRLFAAHRIDVTLYHYWWHKADVAAALVHAAANDAEVTIAPTLEAAVDASELILLTTLWDAPQRQVLGAVRDALVGRILIDVSNPPVVTPAGARTSRPPQGSAGQFVATLLPPGVGQVKAFSNLKAVTLESDADHLPRAVLPFAADSARTAERVRPYFEAIGWQPWLIGDISRSAELEAGGRFATALGRFGRGRLDAEEMLRLGGPEAILS